MNDRMQQQAEPPVRGEYSTPRLKRWGTVADITLVGQTNPGDDVLPGGARGRDGGSINPPGLS